MKLNKLTILFIIIFTCLLNFYQVFDFEFKLDDNLYITDNTVVNNSSISIKDIFTKQSSYGNEKFKNYSNSYRPITLLSFAIDRSILKLSSGLMHFENLILYILICCIVFFLLEKINEDKTNFNLLATLLFVTLPVHQEVIGTIKSRDEIFCLLFLVSSLYVLIKGFKNEQPTIKIIAAALFFLALLSKETGITFIIVYPLFYYFILRATLRKTLKELAFYFLIPFFLYLVIRGYAVSSVVEVPLYLENNALLAVDNYFERKIQAIYLVGVYVVKLVFPSPLLWDYSIGYFTFDQSTFLKGILTIIGFCGLIYYSIKKKLNIVFFGTMLFIATLSITSNIFIEIPATFAERFLFVPSLSIIFLITPLSRINTKYVKYLLIPIVLFSIINIKTISAWKNEITIYEENINEIKSHRAIVSYAHALITYNKKIDKVPGLIIEARKILPRNLEAELAMARYYEIKKDYANAVNSFQIALELNPSSEKIRNHIKMLSKKIGSGNITLLINNLINENRLDEALKKIDKNINQKNENELIYLRGYVNMLKQDNSQAINNFKRALELDKKNINTYSNLAKCYNSIKDKQKALFYLKQAEKIAPNNILIVSNLAAIHFNMGNIPETKKYLNKGLLIDKYNPILQAIEKNLKQ